MNALCWLFIMLNVNPMDNKLPVVTVTKDDTVIAESCVVRIPADTVISDRSRDGAIRIGASNIEVIFEDGSVLRGSDHDATPDSFEGIGIRVDGFHNVTIRNARISGYRCGVYATNAAGLKLEGVDASNNRRQRLRSTPRAEDGGDWLWPHSNDEREWLNNYGAALYIEDTEGFIVRECRVRHGQNALLLSRVSGGEIYDNDFSFNSGWGIGLWRSSRNLISRNAIDFCVRGYSHGVYNRGQDSAGILMFEQCCENVLVENSVTHGGDGFFGFAGREALGESGSHPEEWYRRRGCNDNLLIRNDFSYAPAHGIELTFSFGNKFVENRLVGNAICGVWGGYSCDTLILNNEIASNGEMGYGLERGGVNIEHGRGNQIIGNAFAKNVCGVHLWFDPDENFQKTPWGKIHGTVSTDNLIAGNRFNGDKIAYHFRGESDVTLGKNELVEVGEELKVDAEARIERIETNPPPPPTPECRVLGQTRPVGARQHLQGRKHIVMTEWGPWDHESPLARPVVDEGNRLVYELWNWPEDVRIDCEGEGISCTLEKSAKPGAPRIATISTTTPGVHPFRAAICGGKQEQRLSGTLINTAWEAAFFAYPKEKDPREKPEEWRLWAGQQREYVIRTSRLKLDYGWRGPSEMDLPSPTKVRPSEQQTAVEPSEPSPEVARLKAAGLGRDHFGMVARTTLPLTAGRWRFETLSDDGVRVTVDGKTVIDNWTWHGPTRDTGVFELSSDKAVEVLVEHFELDGYAVLELEITREE